MHSNAHEWDSIIALCVWILHLLLLLGLLSTGLKHLEPSALLLGVRVVVEALARLAAQLALLDEVLEDLGRGDELEGHGAVLGLLDPAVGNVLGGVEADKVEELEGLELKSAINPRGIRRAGQLWVRIRRTPMAAGSVAVQV